MIRAELDVLFELQALSRRSFLGSVAASVLAGLSHNAEAQPAPDLIKPFRFHASEMALDDLRSRLVQTRWPERETVSGWTQGVPEARLRSWIDYWRSAYDWRRCEASLNRFDQFRADIDGLGIHFLHARSPHARALPLIITHGWPSSVIDFLKVVGPLTDPVAYGGDAGDAFDVVIPSLPGFAFSDKPAASGWNKERIARSWATLMSRLGYGRYVAQGGDWGAFVTTAMAQQRASGLAAIHLNFPQVIPDQIPSELSAEERRALDAMAGFQNDAFGYFTMQSTRPQTIGYALADSPAGWAAWLFDIFRVATDNNGDPEGALTRDEMLDQITLYWLTNTAASSARFYFEQRALGPKSNAGVVDLPVGCSIFPHEVYRAPRSWAQRMYPNLFYWNELDRGGHFAALEQPALFVEEMRNCFRPLRQA
ncbi:MULTISPECIES: epoxide hydrolase family protein [unclassified Bradyrhizobium]|uniref:epoxide hydrolase family protein n=1 Tax=unclassified Bradyrhizobium TaxID=2631580 RepID=UPI00211196E1|nr:MULTISPECIES: epoxide hydrolase family protein [unclassified Bradyrhizobium]MCK1711273.1 alpha/beta fold hydrolase [Bradyrhizobium sp. 143]MCK1731495.1 alpha/beta fold hydrolase [Bradyrhizobium sp. 142]